MNKQRDNSDLATKLALRRTCIQAWHAETIMQGNAVAVLDCCAGQNHIWNALRAEYPIKYVGLDQQQHGKANVKVDSVRWLRSVNLNVYDVIDVDTYGEPWQHWVQVLSHIKKSATIFLTCMHPFSRRARLGISKLRRILAGIPTTWELPWSADIAELTQERCLGRLFDYGFTCGGCYESVSRITAIKYLGIRLLVHP